MDSAKIRLSPEEAALVVNGDLILTKNRIMEKAMQLFAGLQTRQQSWLSTHRMGFPDEVRNSEPKISRGENYRGLPWIMLDYPRVYRKNDQFAVRTFFWWGNFFSCTLQLSGIYKLQFGDRVVEAYDLFREKKFYVCHSADPWQHHFNEDNYLAADGLTSGQWKEVCAKNDFLKIAGRIALSDWDKSPDLLQKIFEELMQTVAV